MKTIRVLPAFLLLVCPVLAGDVAPFIRKTTLTNGMVQLETCIRHYRLPDGKGPDIYLTGVSHIGESNYFAALQKHLDAQQLVMFEGVKDTPGATAQPAGTNRAKVTLGKAQLDVTSIQEKLASSLGLVFQLNAIQYDRPNFRNNDVSLAQLNKELKGQPADAEQPEKILEGSGAATHPDRPNFRTNDVPLAQLNKELKDKSADTGKLSELLEGSGEAIETLFNFMSKDPRNSALVKCVLVEVLAEMGNDIGAVAGLAPGLDNLLKVILTNRNEVIFNNLKAELARKDFPSSISMLYGAAHMGELSQRLEKELHCRVVDEKWYPAFGVNPEAEGVDPIAMSLVRFTLRVIKQANPGKAVPPKSEIEGGSSR